MGKTGGEYKKNGAFISETEGSDFKTYSCVTPDDLITGNAVDIRKSTLRVSKEKPSSCNYQITTVFGEQRYCGEDYKGGLTTTVDDEGETTYNCECENNSLTYRGPPLPIENCNIQKGPECTECNNTYEPSSDMSSCNKILKNCPNICRDFVCDMGLFWDDETRTFRLMNIRVPIDKECPVNLHDPGTSWPNLKGKMNALDNYNWCMEGTGHSQANSLEGRIDSFIDGGGPEICSGAGEGENVVCNSERRNWSCDSPQLTPFLPNGCPWADGCVN